MKMTKVPSIVKIEEKELRQLLHQVEETVATDLDVQQAFQKKRKFTAVDLWYCRKQNRISGLTIR